MDDTDFISAISGNYMQKWMALKNFKNLSVLGLQEATPTLFNQQVEAATQIGHNPMYENFINQTLYREMIDPLEVAERLCSHLISSAQYTVESSMLILSHTLLDTTLLELCKFSTVYHPERWDEDINEKTVKFEAVMSNDIQQIRQQILHKKIEELDRKSLVEKADVLYKRCKPEANFCKTIHDEYLYDRERLKTYDEQRHDIVHGRFNPTHQIADFENLLLFAELTGMHFIFMICKYYNTKISPSKAFEYLACT